MKTAKKSEAMLDAETLQRQEENSKAFLAMESRVHDLHRLASITYDYALNVFKIGHPQTSPQSDMELSDDEQENIVFLLEQIVKASAKLPQFYVDPSSADDADD